MMMMMMISRDQQIHCDAAHTASGSRPCFLFLVSAHQTPRKNTSRNPGTVDHQPFLFFIQPDCCLKCTSLGYALAVLFRGVVSQVLSGVENHGKYQGLHIAGSQHFLIKCLFVNKTTDICRILL
ncbi:hypothetical protein FGIG_11700 [Fasciola gigantica]|uniref:Uncharacterized protein n=1 Tax=Fasciola gigantica TaxID=46835 RepID=A0A504YHT1_FASGI|nr:hypothetical protein FGIG_11700 [Fasciola gigantica]